MMKKILFFMPIFLYILTACSTLQPRADNFQFVSKTFQADYQKVWKATMLALEDYPIEIENNEKGYLKTENIPIDTIWRLPFETTNTLKAAKYRLHIRLIKGRASSSPAVQVRVLKKIRVQEGFINESKRAPSDSLEEKALLYRIFREVTIEQAINRHHQRSSSSS